MSEVGGFYWYIIALQVSRQYLSIVLILLVQDLLRATEYTGASGVYAIRYC